MGFLKKIKERRVPPLKQTHLCPPFVRFMTQAFSVKFSVGIDVWSNMWYFWAILHTRSDGVDGHFLCLFCHGPAMLGRKNVLRDVMAPIK